MHIQIVASLSKRDYFTTDHCNNTYQEEVMRTICLTLLLTSILIPFQAQCQVGYALELDGNDDYINLDYRAMNGISDCTVEYWLFIERENGDIAASTISGAMSQAGNNEYLHYFEYANGMRPHLKGQAPAAGEDILFNEWFHFALTREGETGDWISYINGEESDQGRLPGGAFQIANRGLLIGQDQDDVGGRFDATQALLGKIDEFRIFDIIREEEDIRQTMNVRIDPETEGLVAYYRFDEGEGQIVNDLTENEYHGRLGSGDGQDDADPEWVESDAPIYAGEIELSTEFIEFGPVPRGQSGEFQLVLSNVSEEEDEWHNIEFTLSDLGDDPEWLTIQPVEGVVEVGEQVEIELTAETDDLDLGEYEREILLTCNAENLLELVIPVHLFVVEGFGRLHGVVTDAQFENALEGAVVSIDEFGLIDTTDDEGRYDFPEIPAWTYDLRVTLEDYLTMRERDVEIARGREVRVNFALLHSEFASDPENIDLAIAPDDTMDFMLLIQNQGNGPLTWSIDRSFPGVDNDPWVVRGGFPVGEVVENESILAVEFNGTHFFIAGRVDDDDNLIYVFDRDGALVRSFPQPVDSNFGFRDLAWDGRLLWGGDGPVIYGFTTGGDLVTEIESPLNPARCIAWDPERQLFWVADRRSHILGIDLQGREVMRIPRPEDISKYAFAWFPEDPDGYELYILSHQGEQELAIYKIDVVSHDMMLVADLSDIEGASEGGMTISSLWDPFSWVLISILTDANAVSIWQVSGRTDWLTALPTEGITEAGEDSEVTVHVVTSGFVDGTDLEGELIFTHDGVGGRDVVQVDVSVTGDGGWSQRVLSLEMGWNLASLNLNPFDETFIEVVAQLVDNDLLVLAKDGSGHFYLPEREFNNIDEWNPLGAYWLKMNGSTRLRIAGEAIAFDTPIDLQEGWNSVSYLPRQSVDAATALDSLGEALVIAKDGFGRFYLPAYNFSDLVMREGRGYQLSVTAEGELVYNVDDLVNASSYLYTPEELSWISDVEVTESSYSLLLLTENIKPGTRIEALAGNANVAGRGIVTGDDKCGITLWGDDPATSKIEGFSGNEIPIIRLVTNGSPVQRSDLEWLDGEDRWQPDGWGVARLAGDAHLPVEFGFHQVYPNPFNNVLQIQFGLEQHGAVHLKIYDLTGRKIAVLVSDNLSAGMYNRSWDAEGLASGMYLLRLSMGDQDRFTKAVLIK